MGKKKQQKMPKGGIIKTGQQIKAITESGKYLSELLQLLYNKIKPGVALIELEEFAQTYMDKHHIRGAFKGYEGFPANLCLSVNDCVVHGIPDEYELAPDDLLKVDCGVVYRKGISDSAFSKIPGGGFHNTLGQELIEATKHALDTGLKYIRDGEPIASFAQHIEHSMTKSNFSVIENLTGHGVGVKVHEPPHIYNVDHDDLRGLRFQENMVVALEPITAITSYQYIEKKKGISSNGRNLYTEMGDMGAQREYTVLIGTQGPKILSGLQDIPLG